MPYKKRKYLLYGGSGFIGRHLSTYLVNKKSEVTVVSRSPSKEFVAQFYPVVNIINTLEYEENKEKILKEVTDIIYLASQSISSSNIEEFEKELEENMLPAVRVFEDVGRFNRNIKLIYFSSGGTIYGDVGGVPATEDMPARPKTPYAVSKYLTEISLKRISDIYNLNYSIVRPSNPVGKWQLNNLHGFITVAVRNHKYGRPIVIFGDGEQVRDFVHADDLAEAVYLLSSNENCSREIWNIGCGKGYTLKEVVGEIAYVSGRNPQVVFRESRGFDLAYSVLNVDKAKKLLDWEPRRDIGDIISGIWEAM